MNTASACGFTPQFAGLEQPRSAQPAVSARDRFGGLLVPERVARREAAHAAIMAIERTQVSLMDSENCVDPEVYPQAAARVIAFYEHKLNEVIGGELEWTMIGIGDSSAARW